MDEQGLVGAMIAVLEASPVTYRDCFSVVEIGGGEVEHEKTAQECDAVSSESDTVFMDVLRVLCILLLDLCSGLVRQHPGAAVLRCCCSCAAG